jgi:predicted RNA-binding Zn ribbon-like protein
METVEDVTRVRLVGGDLALDFVNTRSGPPSGPPDDDVLGSFGDLVAWSAYAGAMSEPEAEATRRRGLDDPSDAADTFARALRVRDDLDDVFRALAAGAQPDASALARLRDDESDALQHAELSPGTPMTWTWSGDRTPARPLRSVVHAAVQLLTEGELDRIKCCGGCRFLFKDETKNRSRRWCSMEDCGTDEKIRRYVAARRMRATGTAG